MQIPKYRRIAIVGCAGPMMSNLLAYRPLAVAFLCLSSCSLLSADLKAQKAHEAFAIIMSPILQAAQELAKKPEKSRGFIAIAGCSAVGKSHFAKKLSAALKEQKINAAILHLDDFIQPEPVAEPILHSRLDHIKAHAIIEQILRGEQAISKPAWGSGPELVKIQETVSFCDADLIIFEGEYTLCDSETYDFLKYSALRIWMDAADKDIVSWNWQRKRGIRETSQEKFVAETLEGLKEYRAKVDETAKYAHFVVVQDSDHAYSLKSQ